MKKDILKKEGLNEIAQELRNRSTPLVQNEVNERYPYFETPNGPVWIAPGCAMHPLAFLDLLLNDNPNNVV